MSTYDIVIGFFLFAYIKYSLIKICNYFQSVLVSSKNVFSFLICAARNEHHSKTFTVCVSACADVIISWASQQGNSTPLSLGVLLLS